MKYFKVPTILKHPQVVVSSCKNIYNNLAFEDWIYKNVKFIESQSSPKIKPELFMLWRNDKCVVIGRHQNTWAEVNVKKSIRQNIDVARRRSGGGAVYHDLGNLNLTFFTTRSSYNRKRNLNFIAEHLKREWKLDVSINKRDDLLLNDTFKISGTAAKLGSDIAYHHFTLLVDADLDKAQKLLIGNKEGLSSRATSSTTSPVLNLVELRPQLTPELLIESFVRAYSYIDSDINSITIDPTDAIAYPDINHMTGELNRWGWIYGHTPKFSIERNFAFPGIISPIEVKITIDKGVISTIDLKSGDEAFNRRYKGCVESVCRRISGVRYWLNDLETLLKSLDVVVGGVGGGSGDGGGVVVVGGASEGMSEDEVSLCRWVLNNVIRSY